MTDRVSPLTIRKDEVDNSGEAASFLMPPPPPLVPVPPMSLAIQQQKRELQVQKAIWTRVHQQAGKNSWIPTARHGHKALAYKHLMIMFSGGCEGLFVDLNVFNSVTNEWIQPQVKGDIPPGRAAYGAVIDGHRILIFGGVEEYMELTNAVYELNIPKWEWTLLQPSARSERERPCPRMGHSFTLIKDRVFMFGGLTNITMQPTVEDLSHPVFLNDLHILHVRQNMQHGIWEIPVSYGTVPCPRESHSTVAYVSKDLRHNKIVLYGGMFGNRLGDLFLLDVDTMMWSQIRYEGRTYFPLPRSLHTASVVGDRMYVFGGWVPLAPQENQQYTWRCDGSVTALNLKTMTWEKVMGAARFEADGTPGPRAGHSAVVINNKIYTLMGRDGFNKVICGPKSQQVRQACYYDFWKLDVQKPGVPDKVKLFKGCTDRLSVFWDPVPGADGYILQMMEFEMPPSAMVDVPIDERQSVATTPPLPITPQGVSVPTGAPESAPTPVLQKVRPTMSQVGPQQQRQVPANPFQAGNTNTLRLNKNSGVALQNLMTPQVGHAPNALNTVHAPPPRPWVGPSNHVLPNFRVPQTQNPMAPIIPGAVVNRPAAASAQRMSALPPDIARQLNWKRMRLENPLTRPGVQEIMRALAVQQQHQATTPSIPPSVAPPASSRLIRPVAPAQPSSQQQKQSDSILMPPPPAVVPTTTTSSSVNVSTVPGTPPQQLSRPITESGNVSAGSAMIQKPGSLVRILNHSPSAKNQHSTSSRLSLTGSHGIPSAGPAPQLPQQRQPSIVISAGKSQPENSVGHQQQQPPPAPVTQPGRVLTLTPQQLQTLLMLKSQNRTGSYPIRLVAPGGPGIPNQDAGRPLARTRYVAYRLPNGSSVMVPAEMISVSSQSAPRQISVPVPLPIRKEDDGKRKMVAVEGMLQLARGQNTDNDEQEQQQSQLDQVTPNQAAPSVPTLVAVNCDDVGSGGGNSTTETVQASEMDIDVHEQKQEDDGDLNQDSSGGGESNGVTPST